MNTFETLDLSPKKVDKEEAKALKLQKEPFNMKTMERIGDSYQNLKENNELDNFSDERTTKDVLKIIKHSPTKEIPQETASSWYESYNLHEEARQILDAIDEPVLRDIFRELERKSGTQGRGEFIPFERLEIKGEDPKKESLAVYSPRTKKIYLHVKEIARQECLEYSDFRRALLSVLIHEEVHSIARTTSSSWLSIFRKIISVWLTKRPATTIETGYARVKIREFPNSPSVSFWFFNEGITDKLAEDIYEKYLQQTGDRKYFTNSSGESYFGEAKVYLGSRAMVDLFVETVATHVGIPREKVWEAVTAGYIQGIDLTEPSLWEALNEAFFSFIIRVKNADFDYGIEEQELKTHMRHLQFSQETKKKLQESFEKYWQQNPERRGIK